MSAKLLEVKSNVVEKFKNAKEIERVGKTIELGMSLFGTDMGRSTHYNTKEELDKARTEIHDQVFSVDRSIYGCLMCIPGTSDNSKMTAVTKLLSNPWKSETAILNVDDERNIIDNIVSTLQPNQLFT